MKDFNGPRKPGGFGGRGGDRGGFGGRGGRNEFDRPQMHKAICSECGDKCEVPFRPNGTKPVLCSTCFGMQKGGNESRSFGRERMFDSAPVRTMFKATCQDCGAACEVPFKPTQGKPVFCSDCFRGGEQVGKPAKSFERHEHKADRGGDFSALNAKLDQIISLLKANAAPAEKFVMTPKSEKEVKEMKAEKAVKKEAAPKAEKKKAAKAGEPKKAKVVIKVKELKPKKVKAIKK